MEAPPGWLRGKCGERFGLFPENYVEKITEEEGKKAMSVGSMSPEEKTEEIKAPEVSVQSLVAAISQQLGGGSESTGVKPVVVTTTRTTTSTTTTTHNLGSVTDVSVPYTQYAIQYNLQYVCVVLAVYIL